MKRLLKRLSYNFRFYSIWWFCRGIAVLPYWFQYYVLEEIVYFVLRFVVRYRHRLIVRQLAESFPERGPQDIRRMTHVFYRNLAEMLINSVTAAGMSDAESKRRLQFENVEEMERIAAGRDVVGLTSHYGFWEYYGYISQWLNQHVLIAAYHKIKSPVMDNLMLRMRSRGAVVPVSSKELIRFYIKHSRSGYNGKRMMLGLISDQNSPLYHDSHWYRFLNRDTLFFEGGEQLAMKFHLPVFYFEQRRVRRGYYACRWVCIYDGNSPVERYEITERYVRMLEKTIIARPELWLWSHNRWKFRHEEDPAPAELRPQTSIERIE